MMSNKTVIFGKFAKGLLTFGTIVNIKGVYLFGLSNGEVDEND